MNLTQLLLFGLKARAQPIRRINCCNITTFITTLRGCQIEADAWRVSEVIAALQMNCCSKCGFSVEGLRKCPKA